MKYWYEYEHPLPGCKTRQGKGKEVNCWVEQGEGGELEGCCWDKMLEEHFSENNENHRWAFIPFFVETQIVINCQNVILFLRDFGLPHRRAFCHSGLRWRRHFLLQQWWLISFCLCAMNIVHDILNLIFNVFDVVDVKCYHIWNFMFNVFNVVNVV